MFNIKKIFGDKAQMSGIQMMLKGLGFDIESLIPQAEKALLDWFADMETKAGTELTVVAVKRGENFLISLYTMGEDKALVPYGETFALKDFKNFLKNLENSKNDGNIENNAVAAIAAPIDAEPAANEPTGTTTDTTASQPAE